MDHMVQRCHVCSFTFLYVVAIWDVICMLVRRHAAVGLTWLATTCQCATDSGSMQPGTTTSKSRLVTTNRHEKHRGAVSHLRNVASTS